MHLDYYQIKNNNYILEFRFTHVTLNVKISKARSYHHNLTPVYHTLHIYYDCCNLNIYICYSQSLNAEARGQFPMCCTLPVFTLLWPATSRSGWKSLANVRCADARMFGRRHRCDGGLHKVARTVIRTL